MRKTIIMMGIWSLQASIVIEAPRSMRSTAERQNLGGNALAVAVLITRLSPLNTFSVARIRLR